MTETNVETVPTPDPSTTWLDQLEPEDLNAPAPEPVEAVIEPEPEVPAAERARDPQTGQFTPQAPASMPDPVKAAEPEPAKVVPLPVLLEERRNARREIDEAHRKTMELEQRLKALESPPAPEPSFTDDPKAYIDATPPAPLPPDPPVVLAQIPTEPKADLAALTARVATLEAAQAARAAQRKRNQRAILAFLAKVA